jgi:23S rRNA pseudouridine1911/1915/1917 synthase
VRAEYRARRGVEVVAEVAVPVVDLDLGLGVGLGKNTEFEGGVRTFVADQAAAGMRLDAYLAQAIPQISRARAQMLIEAGQVRVSGGVGGVARGKQKLHGGEAIEIAGEPRPAPLRAMAEDIPLEILYEDKYLAVVNKPAGMMVHAGAGGTDDARNRGTLVNALLHHMALSGVGGALRPGIVHRLDKQTSGAIVVAKDDVTHRKLGEMFARREVAKTYVALLHGTLAGDRVRVGLPVARDVVRRTRMTTRRADGRAAVSHVSVVERLATRYGAFTLVEVTIETGRTHQIRVHMQALGHAVVGDTLYGAPRRIVALRNDDQRGLELERNFLHAAHLEFAHPRTGKRVVVDAPLAAELSGFLGLLRS